MNRINPSVFPGNPDLAKLLPVSLQSIGGQDVNAVSARFLYGQIGLDITNWSKWYPRNIVNNEFAEEHRDWEELVIMTSANPAIPKARSQETKDFFLAVPFAKKLAMKAHTPEGERVRDYFLACEQIATRPVMAGITPTAIVQAIVAALGPHPTWDQPLAEKIEQSRRCAKGTYELIKGKVLPLLAGNPPALLGEMTAAEASRLLNSVRGVVGDKRDRQEAAHRLLPLLIPAPRPKQDVIERPLPGMEA